MTFNKILTPVYSAITAFSMNGDGSISATYVIGTGNDVEGEVTNFTPLVTEYKYLDQAQSQEIMHTQFTDDDIGKSFEDLMIGRIYHYMKDKDMIKV